RSSVFRYKGQEIDPQRAGSELKVRAVVTGRIVQIGDTLSIQTELVDVQNQTQLWGEKYRRKVTDIIDLPEDISREISEGLKLELSGETKKQLVKRYTANPQAYELYWKGRYHWNQRKPEDINQAIKYFQEAIKLDPQYALVYSGLADCYVLGGVLQMPPKEAMPLAISFTTGLGRALFWARRYDESIQHLQSALPKDPNYSDTYWSLGLAYEQKRVYAEAIAAFQRAVDLSKTSEATEGKPEMLAALGHAYALGGKQADAKAMIDKLAKLAAARTYIS